MRKKREPQGELIAGFPVIAYQEFLCGQARAVEFREEEWFEFGFWQGPFRRDKPIEPAVEEMLRRGWIEPVPSRAMKQRYKLTDAGKQFAAESLHLFKWPAARSTIRPASRYSSRVSCLIHLHIELARLRTGDPEKDLAPYQRYLLRDLEGGFDEQALAEMHDYWNYNHAVIANRGSKRVSGNNYIMPARPRVDLLVFISSKGNLIVEWCPSGMEYDQLTAECDWTRWRAERHRAADFSSRPSNELLFLHDIFYPTHHFPGMFNRQTASPESVMVNSILLQAAAAMVEELKARLSRSFEVKMVADVFTEWEEIERKDWPSGKADVLASWKIENVAERNERLAAAEAERVRLKELADIERFEEAFGCPLDVFVKSAGLALSPHTISRKLKKDGYSKMMLTTVEHCRAILQRHRPDLLPPPLSPAQAVDLPSAEIVPFRKPTGAVGPSGDDPGAA